jgi:hypothetical protein
MHVWFGQGEVHTHRIRLTPNTNSNHAAQSAAFAAAEAARSAVLFSLSANAEKHQSAAARSCVSVRRSKRSRAGMIRHPSDFDYEDIIPPECQKKSDTHKQTPPQLLHELLGLTTQVGVCRTSFLVLWVMTYSNKLSMFDAESKEWSDKMMSDWRSTENGKSLGTFGNTDGTDGKCMCDR